MATNVILPALGMAQETGLIVRWLKMAGETVKKGEPLLEIETDKTTVEIEAAAEGVLANITAAAGDEIPVGQVIAQILAPGEMSPESTRTQPVMTATAGNENGASAAAVAPARSAQEGAAEAPGNDAGNRGEAGIAATPLASRIAAEHNLDLRMIKPSGRRIQKADVLTYIGDREKAVTATVSVNPRLAAASPKARRLAKEQHKDLSVIRGSGPEGAVLAVDVLNAQATVPVAPAPTSLPIEAEGRTVMAEGQELAVSHSWRVMAGRITQSWGSVPHFYLVREVRANRLVAWRDEAKRRLRENVTYTDLLVKVVAAALKQHPRLNAAWHAGRIMLNEEINIGLAVATGAGGQGGHEGLVVPVIPHADQLGVGEIVRQRQALVTKAQEGRLRPEDISGGTFTISNLGMYGVDAFNAVINPPQAAILAVGRIAEQVIPVDGQPSVQPMMVLTLSCDHRVVDGARGAQFLATLAGMLEEPLALLG
ncbi:MAG TPA: dihydrolipoamide acetyltransferase family protein [Ktedonobacteraceae bacterium]|nr:dihydrolipoamide acetyltransferase family protein [Ktedonobacteraceae bacterium]